MDPECLHLAPPNNDPGLVSTIASAFNHLRRPKILEESDQRSVHRSRRHLRKMAIYLKLEDGPSFDALDAHFFRRETLAG